MTHKTSSADTRQECSSSALFGLLQVVKFMERCSDGTIEAITCFKRFNIPHAGRLQLHPRPRPTSSDESGEKPRPSCFLPKPPVSDFPPTPSPARTGEGLVGVGTTPGSAPEVEAPTGVNGLGAACRQTQQSHTKQLGPVSEQTQIEIPLPQACWTAYPQPATALYCPSMASRKRRG